MALQTFNYHTHTYRCGHAVGREEEYVEAAIKGGFTTLGFSEHMGYQGWDDPNERIFFHDVDAYLEDMYALKEKYKGKIAIRVGLECEYFDDCVDYLKEYRTKCDYMICGQHALDRNEHYYDRAPYNEDEYIEIMAQQICDGIESGLFQYIAHPDYFMLSHADFSVRKAASIRKIAMCAKKHDVVLEVNLKGTKYGRQNYGGIDSYLYPNYRAFEIVADVGCKVAFGYDAHHPDILLQRSLEEKVRHEFEPLDLQFVGDLKL